MTVAPGRGPPTVLLLLLLPAIVWCGPTTCPQPGYKNINLRTNSDPEIQVQAKTGWALIVEQHRAQLNLPVGCNALNFATVIKDACKKKISKVQTDWILNYNVILHECGLQVPVQSRTYDPDGIQGPAPTVLQDYAVGQIKDYQNLVACPSDAAEVGQGAPGGWAKADPASPGVQAAAAAAFQQIVQWKGTGNVNQTCNFAQLPTISVESACEQVTTSITFRVVFNAALTSSCGESSNIQAAVQEKAGAVGEMKTDKHYTVSPWGANGHDDIAYFAPGQQCGGKGGKCHEPASQLYCVDAPYPGSACVGSKGVCVRSNTYRWECT